MRTNDSLPSVARLREVLAYDPDTGRFTWRITTSARSMAGSEAGSVSKRGYRRLRVDGVALSANRVAWAMATGEWPPVGMEVDHANGSRADDRIANLRLATPGQNRANTIAKGKYPKGVNKMFRSGTYSAFIYADYTTRYLGAFPTMDEAAHAYNKAAIETYGEFARLNPVGVP